MTSSKLNETEIKAELNRRFALFNKVLGAGGPNGVSPQLLHELRIYEGQAGIWRDVKQTKSLLNDPAGITMSLLHRGDIYPDDLTEKTLTFHFPKTARLGKTDQNEINATKSASIRSLPVFIITTNEQNPSLRDVKLGYIRKWDDEETFFIEFLNSSAPDAG